MTIIVFLIDTSASMNQRTYLGTTIFDIAKGAVETFMKIRSRDSSSRWDRYMLLTFEDPPANVKAGWKESHGRFTTELKNLQALGLTTLGPALKHTLDLLNVNRMNSGIDTYGQGRCPFYLEPAVIIALTDGKHLTSTSGVQHELNLPMNSVVPGSELTKEPFRWDQRLFGLVMKIPATPPPENQSTYIPSADDSAIDAMCEVTGGRSYSLSSHRMLMQCIESLVQKCQAGVVIHLEKIGPDPTPIGEESKEDERRRAQTPIPQPWHSCRKLIYVPRSAQKGVAIGHWPIPEAFWPDLQSPTLAPRSAHPTVKFSCTPCEPIAMDNLSFDKYELEPSPLTQYILERRLSSVAWQVFVSNSAKYSDIGHPFGYLKASSNLLSVNLFVMPYNYPVLLLLLDELFKVHKLKPTQKWRQQFDNYLKIMPVYYVMPLRKALARMGMPNLVPDQLDNSLSYSVVSYLKKVKNQAKLELDKMISSVGKKTPVAEGIQVHSKTQTSILQRKDFNQLLEFYGGNMSILKQELTDYNTFTLAMPDKVVTSQTYKNPYDIPRKILLDQVARMRANFLKHSSKGRKLQDEETLHSIPVSQMGNYQEYLVRMPAPLREIESQPVRLHTFGNPFKVNKNFMVDEADEAMPGQQTSKKRSLDSVPSSPRRNKRKPGPLPKNIPARKLMSPVPPPVVVDLEEEKESLDFCTPLYIPDEETPETNSEPLNNMNHIDSMDTLPNVFDTDMYEPFLDTNGTTVDNEISVIAPVSHKKQAAIKEHNAQLRREVVREVKKPGRNYQNIFNYLNAMQGNLDTKCIFVQDIMREALRFKKRLLVTMLEQFEESMLKADNNKKRTSSSNQKPPSR